MSSLSQPPDGIDAPALPPRTSSLAELETAPHFKIDEDLLFAYLGLVLLLAEREHANLLKSLSGTLPAPSEGDEVRTSLSRSSSLAALTDEEQITTDFDSPKPLWGKMKSLIGVDDEPDKEPRHQPAVLAYERFKTELVTGISSANGLKSQESKLVEDISNHGVTIESMTESLDATLRKAISIPPPSAKVVDAGQDGPGTNEATRLLLSNLLFSSLQETLKENGNLSYDARLRVILYKLAECLYNAVNADEDRADTTKKRALMVQEVEHAAAQLLWEQSTKSSEPVERTREKDADKWKRWAAMGAGTLGGGVIIGLTGGLATPLIGAGLATMMSGIGLVSGAGLVATLGTTAGAAFVGTIFGLSGGGLTAYRFNRRMSTLSVFEFRPLTPRPALTVEKATTQSLHLIIPVSGWLDDETDILDPWSLLPAYTPFAEVNALAFDPHHLLALGKGLHDFVTSSAVTYATTTVLKQTLMAGLMSAIVWPVGLLQAGYLIDNPWSIGLDRAKKAGIILAEDVLAKRIQGSRPVTLIGFSLGARVIFYCLLQLAKMKAFGLVDHVYLLGAPVGTGRRDWTAARSVVAGRLVNVYAREDWLLGYLFRTTQLSGVAGLTEVVGVPGLEGVDASSLVKSHGMYKQKLAEILNMVQFERVA